MNQIRLCVFLTLLLSPVFFSNAASPNPVFSNIPENTALFLGTYTHNPLGLTCDIPAITIGDYSRFVYDSVNHQYLMFGGGHAATSRDDVDVFNIGTLSWASAYAPTPISEMTLANRDTAKGAWISSGHPISRHTYDMEVFAPNTGELILLGGSNGTPACANGLGGNDWYFGRKISHFNVAQNAWSFSTADTLNALASAEYDSISGFIIIVDSNGQLWTYNPISKVMTQRLPNGSDNGMSYSNNLIYYPPNDRFYYIQRDDISTKVWEVTLNRNNYAASTMIPVSGMLNTPASRETGFAYDSVNKVIGGGIINGMFYSYHPPTKTWTSKTILLSPTNSPAIGRMAFHCLDYDPVNNVFFFLTDYGSGSKMWAYRYSGTLPSTVPARPRQLRIKPS